MRSLFLFVAMVCLVGLSSFALANSESKVARKHKAVMQFNQPEILLGVTLKGEYLFVHDDAAMARGEACTYVYKGTVDRADKLVLSFHCIPVERPKAKYFSVTSIELSPGVVEVREFQFKGETEGHRVPTAR